MTYKNSSKSELFLSMVSVWWAFALIVNDGMFSNLPGIYIWIAEVAGQDIWAFIFVMAAVIKVIGIIGNYGFLRKLGLTFASGLYALITAGYLWAGAYTHTGTGVYFAITVLSMWRLREVRILYAR